MQQNKTKDSKPCIVRNNIPPCQPLHSPPLLSNSKEKNVKEHLLALSLSLCSVAYLTSLFANLIQIIQLQHDFCTVHFSGKQFIEKSRQSRDRAQWWWHILNHNGVMSLLKGIRITLNQKF